MRSCAFEYELVIAETLPTALDLLGVAGNWRPIAGGTDLMVLFNAGKLPYRRLIGIRDIPELRSISISEEEVSIGAAVTYTEIRNNAVLRSDFPLLCQAASWTGGVANQNRGTIAGNIANASPAADSAPMLLVYDAELELASRAGTRRLPYTGFHVAYKQMQMRPDELITRILLPRRRMSVVHYARKVGTRKAQAISKVCVGFVAEREPGGLRNVRIAVGSVAPIPLRCLETEKLLTSHPLSPQLVRCAKETIAREIQPITDMRSTSEYRAQVTSNLLGDFLESLS